jgi:hypothetical protein
MKSENDSKGFPDGRAKQLVLDAFRRHQLLSDSVAHTVPVSKSPLTQSRCSNPKSQSGSISTWNGGVTDSYRWTQTLTELTVEITLPEAVSSKNAVSVSIFCDKVGMRVNDTDILNSRLSHRITVSDSTWTLEDLSRLSLFLAKATAGWWSCVFEGDETIDTSKLESKKRVDEYDEETQGAIRKIMYDENQRRQGLLTSDEMETARKLEKAWNVEGSPFKDTPFDPNIVRGVKK